MKNQIKKTIMWICGLFLLMIVLAIPEMIIAHNIYPNQHQASLLCWLIMVFITMLACLIIALRKVAQLQKFEKEYQRKSAEEASEKLTSEPKKVFIRRSEYIPKDRFECKAKVDKEGKIVCEIFLDIKTTLKSHEEFLKLFQFDEDGE